MTYYSSHGHWSTFGEIKRTELERGNKFTEAEYPDDVPCIWATRTKREALRYAMPASEADRILDFSQKLTKEERRIIRDEISPVEQGLIVWKDLDGGILVCKV